MHFTELALLLLPELYELAKASGRDQYHNLNELAKKHGEQDPLASESAAKFLELGGYLNPILKDQGAILAQISKHGEFFVAENKSREASLKKEAFGPPSNVSSLAYAITNIPVELQESLENFRSDHPYPDRVALIMMRFSKTKAHQEIVGAIKNALSRYDIVGVRADDKQYHDELFPNILTYVYGCSMGIALFERIETEEFNPNISLEVGYMFALRKPVCLLKDKTLRTLHTDLVGRLYKVFDPQEPFQTIPDEISKWLSDKGIVR